MQITTSLFHGLLHIDKQSPLRGEDAEAKRKTQPQSASSVSGIAALSVVVLAFHGRLNNSVMREAE